MSKDFGFNDNNAILTAEEVAEYLKVNKRTVYNLAEKGKIPGVKLGRQWRFKKAMIEKIFFQILEEAPEHTGSG